MNDEDLLRSKIRKIEALFAGAGSEGERLAAEAALSRLRQRLEEARRVEKPIEVKFTFPDTWARQLFVALCRRYQLHPYRYKRQRRTTVMLQAPHGFIDSTLWPEFTALHAALTEYLEAATQRIIREEVHGNVDEADEVDEPAKLA